MCSRMAAKLMNSSDESSMGSAVYFSNSVLTENLHDMWREKREREDKQINQVHGRIQSSQCDNTTSQNGASHTVSIQYQCNLSMYCNCLCVTLTSPIHFLLTHPFTGVMRTMLSESSQEASTIQFSFLSYCTAALLCSLQPIFVYILDT